MQRRRMERSINGVFESPPGFGIWVGGGLSGMVTPIGDRGVPKLNRRVPPFARDALKLHARRVGEIVWAWNFLQSRLFQLFWILTTPTNHKIAHGIWHSIQSDKTQRELVMAAAKGALTDRPDRVEDIRWILDRAEALSPFRNAAAHTTMLFLQTLPATRMVPDFTSSRGGALERLLDAPLDESWQKIKGDLWVLAGFTQYVAYNLHVPETFRTLPNRPHLQSIPPSRRQSKQVQDQHRAAKRQRQRRPAPE